MNELAIIHWLQSFATPALDRFFIIVSMAGIEEFYMLALPFIYWCLHKHLGFRLSLVFLLSNFTNGALKNATDVPRPYQADPGIRGLYVESAGGSSFPSGHAQGNTVFWGYLAARSRSWIGHAWAVLAVALVSLSRMYLGLHRLSDVLAGAAIGILILAAALRLERWVDQRRWSLASRLGLGVVLPLGLLLLDASDNSVKSVGFLMGLAVGYALETEYVRLTVRTSFARQLAKLAIGYGVFFGLRVFTKAVMPPDAWAQLARYLIMGLWAAWIAPWVLVRLRLVARRHPVSSPALQGITESG